MKKANSTRLSGGIDTELIDYFRSRASTDELVFITNSPQHIKERYLGGPVNTYIACSRLQLLFKRNEFLSLPEGNIKLVSMHRLKSDFWENKIVICGDYLENNFIGLILSRHLRFALNKAHLSITSVRTSFLYNIRVLRLFLRSNRTALIGYEPKNNKRLIALSGKLSDVYSADYPLLPVLAIVTVYNESDILESTINHLVEQGVDVHIVDNWSDDGSYEIVQESAGKYPGRISYERFPQKNNNKYEWAKLLLRVTEVANEKNIYKWIISNDADEIRWSPWDKVNLQQAFSFIDYQGYNCADYTVFNFKATKDGFKQGVDPRDFFTHGEFGAENWYFLQLKSWRNNPKAEIASSGGHIVNFPDRKIFPFKFFLGHYPLRSTAQARKKIFKDRKPRFIKEEQDKGWHIQYQGSTEKQKFILSTAGLINYGDSFNSRYLLQRITGIGIRRK